LYGNGNKNRIGQVASGRTRPNRRVRTVSLRYLVCFWGDAAGDTTDVAMASKLNCSRKFLIEHNGLCHIATEATCFRRERRMSTDARTWKSRKLIAVVGALLSAVSAGCERRVASATAPPAPTVEVAPVIQKDVPVEGEWVGTLEGYINAQIQPQVSGYLIRQCYQEGALVRKGPGSFRNRSSSFSGGARPGERTAGSS